MIDLMKYGKQALLDAMSYEISSHEIVRKVLPRIIADATGVYRKRGITRNHPQIRDIYAFYFTLLHNANGQENHKYYGACWFSYERFGESLNIDGKKVRWLSNVLEANGLLVTKDEWRRKERLKLYYPVFNAKISSDGYVVNADGERVIPSDAVYLTQSQMRKRKDETND